MSDAAREASRAAFIKSHSTPSGTEVKKLKDWQRDSLSNQFAKGTEKMKEERTKKDTKKKK